jgi:hypothetical protein
MLRNEFERAFVSVAHHCLEFSKLDAGIGKIPGDGCPLRPSIILRTREWRAPSRVLSALACT